MFSCRSCACFVCLLRFELCFWVLIIWPVGCWTKARNCFLLFQVVNIGKEDADVSLLFTWAVSHLVITHLRIHERAISTVVTSSLYWIGVIFLFECQTFGNGEICGLLNVNSWCAELHWWKYWNDRGPLQWTVLVSFSSEFVLPVIWKQSQTAKCTFYLELFGEVFPPLSVQIENDRNSWIRCCQN